MAEITTQTTNNKSEKRINKKSTKVDLTPMVDLGFLLITFFVFTTSMTLPTSMKVVVPKETDIVDGLQVPESSVLTVILDDENKIFYYEGAFNKTKQLLKTTNDVNGIRTIFMNKKRSVALQPIHNKMNLIIKCANTANYKNLVDILDEVTINQIPIYFIDKLTDAEKELMKKN